MNVLLSIVLSLIGVISYSQNNADMILGRWKDCQDKATFEVYKQDNQYFAKIIGLTKPTNEKGEMLLDGNNPYKALRKNTIMGLMVLTNLQYEANKNDWKGGTAYDPEKGIYANCRVVLASKDVLLIKASKYLVTETRKWNRYE